MSETEAMGGDPDAQAILDEVTQEGGGPSTETGGAPAESAEPQESARQAPAHSDPAEKFIEVAGQKFRNPDDVYRWAERLFNRNSQLGREGAEFRKKYEKLIKFQERLDKDEPYRKWFLEREAEYERQIAQGATHQQAKDAANELHPKVRETIEKVDRYEKREQEREAKADADRTVKERADFIAAHPELKPAQIDKVVERMLYHAEKYGVEIAYEDALAEIEVEELRAKNTAQREQLRKVKADSDIGPGQGSPHKPRKRDLTREGTDEEFARETLAELQAGGHVPSD